MTFPTVSVVTPTWQRHELLIKRCIPSVKAQDYPGKIEHVIVTGPDPELREQIRCVEMTENVADGGATPRRIGTEHATGEIIAYLDDDNAYRSNHLSLLVAALIDHPEADFAYSQMLMSTGSVIGSSPPSYSQIDTSIIIHRRELLERATWLPPANYHAPDWEVVERWLGAGARWVWVPEVTVDYTVGAGGGSR
jgi:glycosyltransferase involved in cell wall biosynthesis